MFRKLIKGFMAVALVFSSLWAAVGCSCSDPDDEFPSAENAEFDEYSAKVIAIMDRIGILDATTLGVSNENEGTTASLLSNTYAENKSEIWNIVEGVQDTEVRDLYYTFQDAFEQSYFIPLIVGRAISEYYGEANFYGVKVNTPWNQYVETVKNGNVTTTSVYTPAGEVFDKETFIVMNMNYVSLENYTLSFILFNIDESRLYYFNLDHQGNLIAYSYNSDGEEYNNFVLYSNDGFDGYEITDMTVCNSVKELLIDEFRNVNKDNIRNIKNGVKHNIDVTKWDWASGYFFGGSDGHVVDHYSFIDEDSSVLASIGSDGTKTTLTIPRNVRFLSTTLLVGNPSTDGSSDAITLVIPETVRGIKKYDNNHNIVDASIDELIVVTHDGKTLANIQVAENSPLFMAGEGDLKDLEGNVIYHMNKPVVGGVLDITSMVKRFAADPSRAIERDYVGKDLYVGSVHTINLEIENTISNYDLRMITSLFPNLRTMNISGTGGTETRMDLTFSTRDVTINYNVIGKVDVITDFKSIPTNHKLNVLNSDVELAYEDASNTVRATVPWTRKYHEFAGNEAPLRRVSIENITFATDTNDYDEALEDTEMYQDYDLDGWVIKINSLERPDLYVDEITIPSDYYSRNIAGVIIGLSNGPVEVTLPNTLKKIYIYNYQMNYEVVNKVIFNGTLEEFESKLANEGFIINLKCSDYEGVYTSGYARVSVDIEGSVNTSVVYCSEYEGVCTFGVSVDRPEYIDDNYDYYFEDQYGNKYVYYGYNDSVTVEIECEYARDVLYLTLGRSLKENTGGGDKPRN